MKSLLRRRPSPAMVIALIALFVSLSGVSYGVATGFIDSREIKNNEVRSRDIRNNDVRTRDLRNNEVRGIDIRNSTVRGRDVALNTLTGDDIREDTLGKVPSAASADSATTAGSAGSAGSVSTLRIVPPTTVAQDASATLASHGPLSVVGTCGSANAAVSVHTTESNSAAGNEMSARHDVDPGDPEAVGTTTTLDMTDVFASAPSGAALTGQVALYRNAASCRFHGHLVLEG